MSLSEHEQNMREQGENHLPEGCGALIEGLAPIIGIGILVFIFWLLNILK